MMNCFEINNLTYRSFGECRFIVYFSLLFVTIIKSFLVSSEVVNCSLTDGAYYVGGFHYLISIFGHPFFEQTVTQSICMVGSDYSFIEAAPSSHLMAIGVGFYYYLLSIITVSIEAGDWFVFIQFMILAAAVLWMRVTDYSPVGVVVGILVVCHPDSIKYSIYMGKETLLLVLLAVNVYLFKKFKVERIKRKKNWFSFWLLLLIFVCFLYGTIVRPYYIFILYASLLVTGIFPFKYGIIDYRYLFPAGAMFALYISSDVIMIAKVYLSTVFSLLFSPNFFRLNNYENYTLATVFSFFVFVVIFFNGLCGIGKRRLFLLLSLIMMYAIPLSLVVIGYNSLAETEQVGFNIPRSRYPYSFVYYSVVVILCFNFAGKLKVRR